MIYIYIYDNICLRLTIKLSIEVKKYAINISELKIPFVITLISIGQVVQKLLII